MFSLSHSATSSGVSTACVQIAPIDLDVPVVERSKLMHNESGVGDISAYSMCIDHSKLLLIPSSNVSDRLASMVRLYA